jgi:hypothetical protein
MTIEAELPDGTILEFPDGTDPQVIQGAAKKLLGVQPETAQPQQELPPGFVGGDAPLVDTQEDIGALEAAAIGAGRGITKIGRALGFAEQEDPRVTESFQELEELRPISTFVGEVAGESAPFLLPGVAAGGITALGARAGATAALGATEGALIARGEGRDVAEQIGGAGLGGLIAGTLELALPRISRLGNKVIRRILNKAPDGAVVDASGNPSQEFVAALQQSGKTFDDVVAEVNEELIDEGLDPTQVSRKAFLESQGLQPSKAQVTRSAADFQAQQEAAKTSTRARELLERQEAVLTSRFNNAVLDTGGDAATPTSTVTDALVGKATTLDEEISTLYTAAREAAPGEKNIKFNFLTQKLKDLAPSNRRAGGNIEAVVGDLQSKGVLSDKMKVTGKIDVEAAEDVRKLMNELFDPQNGFGNGVLRELKDALDDDVFMAAGRDVFQQGRAAKRDFEKELSRAKVSKFDNRKANLVRDVLENKIDPDRFSESVVFSKKYRATDVQQLKDYISTDEAGKAAFDDLRADVVETIKNRSFIGPLDDAGNKALSRDRLEKSLASVGSEKMKVLFTPDERKFFDNMLQAAKLREPVRGTALGRGPSAQAISRLEQSLKANPIVGALVSLVDFDSAGRAVLKASPERAVREIGPSAPRQAISQAAAIGGVTALPEDE